MATITVRQVQKIIRSKPMPKSLERGFIDRGWEAELPGVYLRTAALLAENANAPKALQMHLKQLLPTIAFYEAAKRLTGSTQAALDFMEQWAFVEMKKLIPAVQFVMKLGLYRLLPTLCGFMLDRMFGRAAGFDYRLVPDAPKFSVDMTRCPYVETCVKYGVPEVTQFACRADDVIYGNLHPRLIWARTQTLGMGGGSPAGDGSPAGSECCDFRLHVKEK